MNKVLFISLIINVLCTLFLFWQLYRWRGFRLWMPLLLTAALILCFWFPLALVIPKGLMHKLLTWAGNIWAVLAAFFTGIALLLELTRLLVKLYSKSTSGKPLDILPPRRSVPLAMVLVLLLTAYAAYEARDVRVKHLAVQTDKLPHGLNQYRIIFVTDIHLNEITGEKALERITTLIKEENADLLLFGGDIVDYWDMRRRPREAAMLAKPIFPKDGSLAVLGNHEALHDPVGNAIPFLQRAWMYVLRNEAIAISALSVVGLDDPAIAQADGTEAYNPIPLLGSLSKERFTVLLKHQPDIPPGSVGLFDLQLSGHTHGGQIWPASWLVELFYGTPQGKLNLLESPTGKTWYYCSAGTGFSSLPLRFLTPPEIVVIDLVR